MKRVALLAAAVLLADVAQAATVTISASKDNTLYENSTGTLSNGAGEFFFAGRTGASGGNLLRRGLIAFDIASQIPAGSTIDMVTLRLHLSNANLAVPEAAISLHSVLADWGEGSSNAGAPGGTGALATTDDATWIHRQFNTTSWSVAGGDFVVAASISATVGGIGTYDFSSAQMAADVQSWLTAPASNFGWIVRGGEGVANSARRFDSSENAIAANRPSLTVIYTPIPEPSNLVLLGCGSALLFVTRRRSLHGKSHRWDYCRRRIWMPISATGQGSITNCIECK